MNISYIVQKEALGIANAIDISRSFIADHHLAVILGDNVFYGSALTPKLIQASSREVGATIFCNEVKLIQKDLGSPNLMNFQSNLY